MDIYGPKLDESVNDDSVLKRETADNVKAMDFILLSATKVRSFQL